MLNPDSRPLPELLPEELDTYAWQLDLPGFSATSQRKLKAASVLVSRVGGIGGLVALQLAAAGIGRLVLASGGPLQPSDLNRQLLQTHDHLGQPRMDNILRRIRALNPRISLEGHPENISESNATTLVAQADIVVDAAPLFAERFALNRAAVHLHKPMVECAMYAWEARITTLLPPQTGCLACLHPEPPPDWTRKFPVLGAVSGTVACLAATEVVKLLTGTGTPLANTLLSMDLASMRFRRFSWKKNPACTVCGTAPQNSGSSAFPPAGTNL